VTLDDHLQFVSAVRKQFDLGRNRDDERLHILWDGLQDEQEKLSHQQRAEQTAQRAISAELKN